ncbi:MAG: fibronectin type III domain-containing protein [Eubacterium sp.]|nr:fibronectin type III domain-containing protein [Eubacterium sp.]
MKTKKIICMFIAVLMLITTINSFNVVTYAAGLTAPKKITAQVASPTQVAVYWSKTPKAKGYYLYRSTKKNSGYKKIRTTKATRALVSNLTSGKRYYFKVAAYKGNTKRFSKVKACTPKADKVKNVELIKRSNKSVGIYWIPQAGVSGYDIFYSTNNKSYKRLKTVKGCRCTVSNLSPKKTYYFKLRAFKKVKKKKACGAFSSAKKCRLSSMRKDAISGDLRVEFNPQRISYDYSTDTYIVKTSKANPITIRNGLGNYYRKGSVFSVTYKSSSTVTQTDTYKITYIDKDSTGYCSAGLDTVKVKKHNSKTGRTVTSKNITGYPVLYRGSKNEDYSLTYFEAASSDYRTEMPITIRVPAGTSLFNGDTNVTFEEFYNERISENTQWLFVNVKNGTATSLSVA